LSFHSLTTLQGLVHGENDKPVGNWYLHEAVQTNNYHGDKYNAIKKTSKPNKHGIAGATIMALSKKHKKEKKKINSASTAALLTSCVISSSKQQIEEKKPANETGCSNCVPPSKVLDIGVSTTGTLCKNDKSGATAPEEDLLLWPLASLTKEVSTPKPCYQLC